MGKSKGLPGHQELLAELRLGKTLEAVGGKYGVSRERVRQVVTRGDYEAYQAIRQERRNLRNETIMRMAAEGLGDEEIAQALGLGVGTAMHLRQQLGLRSVKLPRYIHDAKVVELHQAGLIQTRIAEVLKLKQSFVSKVLIRNGYKSYDHKPLSERKQAVKELAAQGLNARSIAEALSVSVGYTKILLHSMGIGITRARISRTMLYALEDQGLNASEIAAQTGHAKSSVYRILTERRRP